MSTLLAPLRFVFMILTVLTFILVMSVVFLFARAHWARVRLSNVILTRFCRFSLRILNVRVSYDGVEPAAAGSSFYVANHHSYLDILAIHARVPVCFVTSREMRETPVLGAICALAGCLFVERRKFASLRGEVGQIVEGLERGFNLGVFPEATSGNGDQLKPFKRSLFAAAERAARPVRPVVLNYERVGGRALDARNRDSVFWYGDMAFAPHLWALCASGGAEVRVTFLEALPVGGDAGELAAAARAVIAAHFRPVPRP